jgi:cytochrome c oxidase subunit II
MMLSGLMPPNVSTFGGQIDSVFYLILYIVGFWFILTEGLLIYFALSSRRKMARRARYVRGETPRQMAWVLTPALVVLCLDLGIDSAGNSAWELAKNTGPPSSVEVKVIAKQFNWEFTYPGPDGKIGTADDVSFENELHVPVGKVVHLTLTSEDVIHSLWVPNFRLKQDVVPGRAIPAWFEATKPGTYEIACSELCGFGHYSMHGTVTVQTQQDYENWIRNNITHHAATASANQ